MTKLAITNEIVSCLISSGMNPQGMAIIKASPKQFLQTLLKTKFSEEYKVQMVENTQELMHLALPYYAQVEKVRKMRNSYIYGVVQRFKDIFARIQALRSTNTNA